MTKLLLTAICFCAMALCSSSRAMPLGLATAHAQDHDQDRDHDRAQMDSNRDESAYYNNQYYKEGWNDGEHHKHREKKWKNDADRQAYEAGYVHGDRGEKWTDHNHDEHR